MALALPLGVYQMIFISQRQRQSTKNDASLMLFVAFA